MRERSPGPLAAPGLHRVRPGHRQAPADRPGRSSARSARRQGTRRSRHRGDRGQVRPDHGHGRAAPRQVARAGRRRTSGPGRFTRTNGRSRPGSVRRSATSGWTSWTPTALTPPTGRGSTEGLSASTVHKYHCICRPPAPGGQVGMDRHGADGPGHAARAGADRNEGPDARPAVDAGEGCRGQRPGPRHGHGPGRAHRGPPGRAGGPPVVGHRPGRRAGSGSPGR